MIANDFDKFAQLWIDSQNSFNRTPTDNAINIAFEALSDCTIEEVEGAIFQTLRTSRFAPTIADIVEQIKINNAEDEASLESKATAFYHAINCNFDSGEDVVTTDERGVIAFKQCFGSLRSFGTHTISADPFDKKTFIATYKNIRPEQLSHKIENFVLKGIYENNQDPIIRFIGDYSACQKISKKFYGNYKYRLPAPPKIKPLLENKSNIPHSEQPPVKIDVQQMISDLEKLFRR